MNNPARKEYIGDAVYAEINDAGQIELSTSDGYATTNLIYLEPEVVRNLISFVKRWEYA